MMTILIHNQNPRWDVRSQDHGSFEISEAASQKYQHTIHHNVIWSFVLGRGLPQPHWKFPALRHLVLFKQLCFPLTHFPPAMCCNEQSLPKSGTPRKPLALTEPVTWVDSKSWQPLIIHHPPVFPMAQVTFTTAHKPKERDPGSNVGTLETYKNSMDQLEHLHRLLTFA